MTAFGFWLKVGRPVLRSVGRAEDDGREGGRNSIIDFDILFEGAMASKEEGREGGTVRDGEGKGGVGERGGTANNISSFLSLFLYYLNEHRCLLDGKGREKAAARCLHSVFVEAHCNCNRRSDRRVACVSGTCILSLRPPALSSSPPSSLDYVRKVTSLSLPPLTPLFLLSVVVPSDGGSLRQQGVPAAR